MSFNWVYFITNCDLHYRAAVKGIMMKLELRNKPDAYRILHFEESSYLSEQGFYRLQYTYYCCIKQAWPDSIGIHLIWNSTVFERQKIETALINQ